MVHGMMCYASCGCGLTQQCLSNMCTAGGVVIDSPAYLKGLWAACEQIAQRSNTQTAQWRCAKLDLGEVLRTQVLYMPCFDSSRLSAPQRVCGG